MISTTGRSGHHQQQKQSKYSHSGAATKGPNMTELNGENAAATRLSDDQQTPSKFSNGIGGLFKRLSPKYRSRSKSPAAHSQQRIEKTWVTVEIKDCHHPPSPVGASPMGNSTPPTTSSSSPSSPVLRNGGATSPDKSPRLRGAWGNLFHRGSMKKPRDSSSGHKAAKIEARTRSEHELDGNGVDIAGVRMTSTHSTDLASGHWRPSLTMPVNAAQRLTRENGGDIRDGLGATAAIAARGTLSEEDLVSKSLSRERGDVFKPIIPRGTATTGVQSSVPASLTTSTTYHSQDSVFDSPSRMPSYIRISCTLSGYRNYRNVDLKAAQSPKQVRSPPKLEPTAEITQPDHPIVTTPVIPIGKSIVERRLEKFEAQPSRQPATAPATSPKEQMAPTAPGTTEAGGTPTPIRDLISNFNKMSIHDPNSPSANRPRQKPPPIPPKRDRLLDKLEQAQDVPEPPSLLENGLKQCPVSLKVDESGDGVGVGEVVEASSQKKSIQNGVHEGHDAIFAAFPDSTTAERTVNGAFQREPVEDGVTTTVAERAVDAAVAEAMKHVSASFIQSHQLRPQHGSFMSQEEATTVEGSRLEEITQQRTTTHVSQLQGAAENTMNAAGDGGHTGDGVKMTTVDGYYYQAEAAKERERLERLCAEVEIYLGKDDIPDEASERIRMAVGRVRLLLSKKFAKFEELIENNLHPTPDDPRPTHVSDLEGYYELVKMEIEDIDACFDVVQRMKANNWRAISAEGDGAKNQSKSGHRTPPVVVKGRQPPPRKGDKESSNARSEAAKQRLKEAKEAAMQRKKQAEVEGGFVPEEPVCPS